MEAAGGRAGGKKRHATKSRGGANGGQKQIERVWGEIRFFEDPKKDRRGGLNITAFLFGVFGPARFQVCFTGRGMVCSCVVFSLLAYWLLGFLAFCWFMRTPKIVQTSTPLTRIPSRNDGHKSPHHLREEVEEGYLGLGGKGRVLWLDPQKSYHESLVTADQRLGLEEPLLMKAI